MFNIGAINLAPIFLITKTYYFLKLIKKFNSIIVFVLYIFVYL